MSDVFAFEELTAVVPSLLPTVPLDSAPARDFDAELAAAREQGRNEALAELAPVARSFEALVGSLQAERARLADDVEAEAVELAVKLAGKILAGALEADPALVLESVRGALRRIVERQEITVLVNPDDIEMIREAIPELASESGNDITVRPERRVAPGGCQLRTATGEIDARISAQLDRARELMAERGDE